MEDWVQTLMFIRGVIDEIEEAERERALGATVYGWRSESGIVGWRWRDEKETD